jgi:hypothetical protein
LLIGLFLFAAVFVPISRVVLPVSAQSTLVLTAKWSRSGLGSNWEGGLVIGDVTGDGQEDVVYAGCGNDRVYVLDGYDGSTVASYYNSRIGGNPGSYSQPQLYDVDNDGILEILVPLFWLPGLAVVEYDGSATLSEKWVRDVQGSSGSGSIMSKPVAGDIDGDGDLEIFVASQDVGVVGGYDGTITMFDHLGNVLHQTFCWRSCSGGLSLSDTDSDGVFELYLGDRQMGYEDGGYGKGTRSFWAENLTERWNRFDYLSSSQSPVIADVDGDGVKDVLAGMYNEMNIQDSSNGEWEKYWWKPALSVHYGFTVYDIDNDGNLELLSNDGDHDDNAFTDVFDLVTGEMDAQLPLAGGDWKWSPLVADIDPTHPGMEIVSCPNGTTLEPGSPDYAVIMIFDSSYESIQNITRSSTGARLVGQLGYPFVQDIDADGLLELVTESSSGVVYAYDTQAPAPGYSSALPGSQRIRSEVTYFGEERLGVAEHTIMPWAEDYWTAPLVAPVSPADNILAVPVSTNQLSFRLRDHQGDDLSYSVTTTPDVGSTSGVGVGDTYNWGVYTLNLAPLAYDTTYRWTVTANDGSETTERTYTFHTEMGSKAGNSPPSQDAPLLMPLNETASTYVCYNQSTTDADGDEVTNVYRWLVDGESVDKLLLPFDTRNETLTADYSGYGNDGEVNGAVWVPNGVVGGAYLFDGKDDSIMISDGGAGYFDDHRYPDNHPELGGFGDWSGLTVEAWIYLAEYNYGSRVVAKVPSYTLGFQSGYANRIYASVWPATGEVATDPDGASLDLERSVSANVDITLNKWYYIAFTYESGVGLKLFFNGELVGQSSAYQGDVKESSGEPVYIGRLVQPFAGMIDEVRVSSFAKPEQQIRNRYLESKDGLSNSSIFTPGKIASAGDTLTCQVIPTDSWEDGAALNSNALIVGEPENTAPTIHWFSPVDTEPSVVEGASLVFMQVSSDPEGDALSYSWTLDAVEQGTSQNWTYYPDIGSKGAHVVRVTVTDTGGLSDFREWVVNVEAAHFSLTILQSSDGATDPAYGVYSYEEGSGTSILAVPDVNYRLSHWLLNGSGVGVNNPLVVSMTNNWVLEAVFVPVQHALTVNVLGGGSVSKDPDLAMYNHGDSVTLTAVAAEGYIFSGWSGDISGNDSVTDVTLTEDKEVTATFVPVFNLLIENKGQGLTDPLPGSYLHAQGEEVAVKAEAEADNQFVHWLLNGTNVGSANPYLITMDNDCNLTAVFQAVEPDSDSDSSDVVPSPSPSPSTSPTPPPSSNPSPSPSSTTPQPSPSPGPLTNRDLYIGAVAAAFVAVIAMFLVKRRRKNVKLVDFEGDKKDAFDV